MPLNNAIGTIVLGADASNVDAVFVGGTVRKWDGKMLDIDMDRLRNLAYASRDYLTEKAGIQVEVTRSPTRKEVVHDAIREYLDTHNRNS